MAVQFITENTVSQMRHVQPQLMSPSGLGRQYHSGIIVLGIPFGDLPFCDGLPPLLGVWGCGPDLVAIAVAIAVAVA
eukprot:CAMPEP_0202450934 /NCGR_PEP_ID=MMETSP1360-20130828/9469_1 /ASSEMBLY_ACC=CAM_ASM_000848 /TAXON_ID=515479 /ORGANISM="Licmophora paradoxa, Strain CCMP2313" /LENGTH=76 /DNA_ID=CAMNT_0049069371 /DNA_START=167 /DNA_END=394 /DNA_ORIENTATION=-